MKKVTIQYFFVPSKHRIETEKALAANEYFSKLDGKLITVPNGPGSEFEKIRFASVLIFNLQTRLFVGISI
jgi:hypothetical protein